MKRFSLSILLLCTPCAAAAQVTAAGPPATRPQQAAQDTVRPIRLGLLRLPPVVPIDFSPRTDLSSLFASRPFGSFLQEWSMSPSPFPPPGALSIGARRATAGAEGGAEPAGPAPGFLPPAPVRDTSANIALPGALGRYADIGMRLTGYGELGGAWTRFKPCDPSLHLNCNPGLFPQIKPDVQFNVQVGGTISNRLFVNVDYDQTREETFNSNVINVYYQGLQDEVIQRIEVGDVQFRAPQSRYLTRGIPAGNFGFMMTGQLGPMDFQTVWAQQRGDLTTREFRLEGGGTEGVVQDDRIVLDDADYVKGQFFYIVDPDSLRGAPHIDALALLPADAPSSLRPLQGGAIEVYRDERIPPQTGQQQINLFLGNAVSADGSLKHAGQFRRLDPEQDYRVHQSGLWIMLRSPLRPDEALAISYRTERGDTIGTLDAERSPAGTTPVLRLVRSPAATHQPGRPTWPLEMHNVYRINSSSGVDPSTIDVHISLGDIAGGQTFLESGGRQITFLRLFGLDEDAPADRVDATQVYQPDALGGDTQGPRITGTYLFLPTLQPFLQPPPVPSENLTAQQAAALLGSDANATIYENTDPVLRDGAGRFRLNLAYRVRVEGIVGSFSLGQFGIREGSERVSIGDRRLERGVDYTMDYEIGQITLNNAASLFGADPNAQLRVQVEQRKLFEVAPTSMFGANLTYKLGQRGNLNFVGLYQSEKTLYTRPQLGNEPAAGFVGGLSADLDLGGGWLDRALGRMPGLRTAGGSAVRLTGEVAVSGQDPNRGNQGYFDDFESTEEIPIDVRRQTWRLGSRPAETTGDDGELPLSPDATTAARLVWQHDVLSPGGITGSLIPGRDIDQQINTIGNQIPEPAMWLTYGENGDPPGRRLWRSITTVLSTTGLDMTRDEFFELYVNARGTPSLSLIFDFGTVGEDAMYVDSTGATNGTDPDGRPWGLGRFDEEARVADREIWGTVADMRGLWNPPCLAKSLQAYELGDERSNCTRGNGVNDTEDLDGNGILDENDGPYHRFTVRLDGLSPYVVSDTTQTGTGFRLYRIPLRSGAAVNGAVEGTWRFVKHLRMTVAGAASGNRRQITIARMRIIGSRWTKRDVDGVLSGLIGDRPSPAAAATQVRVGPVSRITDRATYTSPPGIRDELQDPSAQFGASGIEVNEKSLRLAYDGLEAGDRAEIYFRYPQQPRSLMEYRQLRLWALARAGNWGPQGGERLLVKAGTDPRNYYLFQTRLKPAPGSGSAKPGDWLPEIVIDFDRWFQLRVEAENRLARLGPGTQDTVWSADSTYALVLEDRARAPNLAAIREVSFAVYNGGIGPAAGEVWIDDIRLDHPVRDPGTAASLNLDMSNDFMAVTVGYGRQSPVFRQLDQDASFVGSGDLSLSGRAQLDRMLPESWGLDMPVSVSHSSSSRNPDFLERSDVIANDLTGLRDSGGGSTSFGVRISKRTPSANPILGLVADGTTLSLGYDDAHSSTITSRNESGGFRGAIDYRRDIARHDIDIVPGFLESALRAITPAAIERTTFFERLAEGRVRWSPERVGFGSSYVNATARSFRYTSILEDSADTRLRPIESPRRLLDNTAEITLAPVSAITASLSVRSARDLLDAERASPIAPAQQALQHARSSFAGADIGWESNRTVNSTVSFRPLIASWLRPSYTYSNRYQTDRNASYYEIVLEGGDSVPVLQRRFGSDRRVERRLDFQPATLVRTLHPDSAEGAVLGLVRRVENVSITWNSGLNSQFDRETFEAGLGYRFGLGGFDSFRAIDGDTAVVAADRSDFRAASTVSLPLGSQLTMNYTNSTNEGVDLRGGGRTQSNRTWPSLRLAWRSIPLPQAITRVLTSASFVTGYERVERHSTWDRISGQERAIEDRRFPLELSLTIANTINATWSGMFSRGTTTDPTGNGEQDAANHTFQIGGSIRPPAFLGEKMRSPIQAMLVLIRDDQQRCRYTTFTSTASECVSYIDATNRSLNFTLDTILSDITVGLRTTWTDRQNRVGTRTGNSQFQVALFGRFNFVQGVIPGR